MTVNGEFKLHVYRKQQTSDSSWESLKIENEQIKQLKIAWNLVTWYKFMFAIWHKRDAVSNLSIFPHFAVLWTTQCITSYYWYIVQVFILHVAIIEAKSILSVHQPVLKNTDQGWWTFQNGKLLAKGQCRFSSGKWKVTLILNERIVPVWTPYLPNRACDSWFVLARPFWNLPGWVGECNVQHCIARTIKGTLLCHFLQPHDANTLFI